MHPKAGQPASQDMLVSIPKLMSAYYTERPDPENPSNAVIFGTSGHRGMATNRSFNEAHIVAICQAVCDYRKAHDINGPLFIGKDTHALSEAAFITAMEVLVANEIQVFYQKGQGYTPTPVISHAIINFNKIYYARADGLVLTPSHNPPSYGGIKYNPPHGGPAEKHVTDWITRRANTLVSQHPDKVTRIPFQKALHSENAIAHDYISPYVEDLKNVVNMDVISHEGLKIAIDPLGGTSLDYWEPVAETYGLNIQVINKVIDPTFSFMTLDKDGQIRMDCSSPWAMQRLIHLKDNFDLAIGNDPDADRHGIVTGTQGLMKANEYLAVCVDYLFRHRKMWGKDKNIGKSIVTTTLIDRLADDLDIPVYETPVGFKWYEPGLSQEKTGYACEESAGATFLRQNGTLWTTDKDGIITGLLAAEMMATTGHDLSSYYNTITQRHGNPCYSRTQITCDFKAIQQLGEMLSGDRINLSSLAGEKVTGCQTLASGNKQPVNGIKLSTKNAWAVIRPSGTESAYKIYAESFNGEEHVKLINDECRSIASNIIEKFPNSWSLENNSGD